jgi:ferrochelatase
MKYFGLNRFQHSTDSKVGLLLINLGSPSALTNRAVRRYLKVFLSDPRVVEIPRLVWMIILHGIILRIRPGRSKEKYAQIWTDNGSPLLVHSQHQADKMSKKVATIYGDQVVVRHAMRYGEPHLETTLKNMQLEGVRDLVVLPLYPQYSGSTAGSVFDEVARVFQSFRWVPNLQFIGSYHDNPVFIDACVARIRRHWETAPKPERLMLSFHGTPKKFLIDGDPYYCQCLATSRLIATQLEADGVEVVTTFQSRFGKAEWLQPYTDKTLESLAHDGIKDVQIFCPGFAADCLETLEEIAMENKDVFLDAGGQTFGFISSLNAEDAHIDALLDVVTPYLQQLRPRPDTQARHERAQAAGYRQA